MIGPENFSPRVLVDLCGALRQPVAYRRLCGKPFLNRRAMIPFLILGRHPRVKLACQEATQALAGAGLVQPHLNFHLSVALLWLPANLRDHQRAPTGLHRPQALSDREAQL